MGMKASIDVNFMQEYSPKDILKYLITSGWSICYENTITYLLSNDTDDYDWQHMDRNSFELEEFLNSHNYMDKIGIVIIAENSSGGYALIHHNYLSISLSINRICLTGENIPDFNWYLKRMSPFLNTINISSIQCETTY